MFNKRIAIDLGTANTRVYIPKKGLVANEPSVVAISVEDNRIVAIGNDAKEMLGRTPDTIVASKPLRNGVIANYRITEALLKYFLNKISGHIRLTRPELMMSVPSGITSTERRAVIDAAIAAGAKKVYIIRAPVAAAIGANVPIAAPAGNLIVDIGEGTTEVAIISLGGIVAESSVRIGGGRISSSIAEHIRKRHGLVIGVQTSEEIKKKIGSATALDQPKKMQVRGRDMVGGLPKTIEVTSTEITSAIRERLDEILLTVKAVLEQTPPELSSDIIDRGMIITGGGALLRNIDKLMTKVTGVPAYIAEDPMLCVIKGAGTAAEHLDEYIRSVVTNK
ncbi:rod shape-determining protein [Patescibacteria group bacterium]|jgi:rod shape-determining protein MreB|nr:rod shape-determining protein [Patescibacteria group bacterium]